MKIACKIVLFSLAARIDLPEEFPKTGGPFIIMFNHSGFIEVFILPVVIHGKFSVVTKKENLKVPVFGSILKLVNAVFIDRTKSKTAVDSVNSAGERLKKGYHVLYAPEGTRSLDGKLKQFKKGGFHLAINEGATILPLTFTGAYEYKPKTRGLIKPGTITVRFGDPILTSTLTREDVPSLLTQVRTVIEELSTMSPELSPA